MLKRLFLTLALLLPMPAMASGTIPLSLSQQFDNSTHLPLAAGKLFTIQAGTTSTPQNAYQDSALTLPYPNPLTLDAGGRIPQLFFADGTIKVRLENSLGVQQVVQDNILVIGPSSGGGGGGTVDPTTILATGDVKVSYTTSTIPGWVRMNGRTIGSATSGATERANLDTQALFQFLWASDANLAVSGGRGASAAADWSANKTIALPDLRGRVLSGLDDMGNTDSARQSAGGLASCRFTLGCAGGESAHALSASEIPTISSTGSISVSTTQSLVVGNPSGTLTSGGTGASFIGYSAPITLGGVTSTGTANLNSNNTGSGSHNNMQPTMLVTFYCKL
jgi:microcystin-dependent protein